MARKHQDRYHHGDLSRALLHEAVRIIQKDGVGALTLRKVGQRLGVSRTALYARLPIQALFIIWARAAGRS